MTTRRPAELRRRILALAAFDPRIDPDLYKRNIRAYGGRICDLPGPLLDIMAVYANVCDLECDPCRDVDCLTDGCQDTAVETARAVNIFNAGGLL